MTDPIRWGVLGAGTIAHTVAADIAAEDGNVVQAVGARDLARAEALASRFGAVAHGSYDDLLADPDVDVVYLATTHAQHHEQALAALRAGKPLLVEKAFTLNASQAREVVHEARSRSLFCMEAMWMRFHPLMRRAVALVADGAIGDVVGVRADLSRRFDYDPSHRLFDLAAGGGALLDLGVYPVTAAWLFLGRPSTVSATGALSPTGSDLSVGLQWGYDDGRFAQVYTSAAGNSPASLLVTGMDGWLSLEDRIHHPDRLVLHTGPRHEVIDAPPARGAGYGLEVAEVARCLREGLVESPVVPLDETIAILEVIDEARAQLGVRYPGEG